VTSFLISTLLSTVTVCGFLVASEQMRHWFVIPVWCCGILIGRDAVDWLRGRLDLFDPAAIIGLLGVHFFFLAPLLHVAWDSWLLPYVEPPPDWRDWLGGMALVNAAGLLLYRGARQWAADWGDHAPNDNAWTLEWSRLRPVAACALMISAALQFWVYAAHGGFSGYVGAVTEGIGRPETATAFTGMGWIFMMSESFPIVAMIVFAVFAVRTRTARSWSAIMLVLLGYFLLAMVFGGLRGSRSQTIWSLFWATGIIHLWIRPLSKKFIAAGVCFLVAFMYLYGFYKGLGHDVLTVYQEGATSALSETSHRTFEGMLLGDLARADVQAFLLYRLWIPNRDYDYAWGRTYLGSIALLIPRRIWPERPPVKVHEGTEALYGVGSYDEEEWVASNVYGLAGETMLNFGPLGVPFAYLTFGLLVGRLQRYMSRLRDGDARWLLCPFIVNLTVAVLHADSDNLLFNFVKDGMVPLCLVWFARVEVFAANRIERGAAILAHPGGGRS
jgi:hypothetical protein